MKKYTYYTLAAIMGLIITTVAVSSMTAASTPNESDFEARGAQFQKQRGEMQQIMEDQDYDAWSTAMQSRVQGLRDRADEFQSDITQENFNIRLQAHELAQSGDREGARELLESSGLKMGPGHKAGGPGFRNGGCINQDN